MHLYTAAAEENIVQNGPKNSFPSYAQKHIRVCTLQIKSQTPSEFGLSDNGLCDISLFDVSITIKHRKTNIFNEP